MGSFRRFAVQGNICKLWKRVNDNVLYQILPRAEQRLEKSALGQHAVTIASSFIWLYFAVNVIGKRVSMYFTGVVSALKSC